MHSAVKRFLRFLIFCVAITGLYAVPPLSTVQDTIYRADGTRFNGSLTLTWPGFTAVDGSNVVAQTISVPIVNGGLRVQIVPTVNALTSVTYLATYSSSDGQTQFQESWAVPQTNLPLRVQDVRVTPVAAPVFGGTGTLPIEESDVIGLVADLAARPISGPAFANGRVALINASGQLDGVAGNAADCVRVDGSTGSCGSNPTLFVDLEMPAGVVDGANLNFALANVPNPITSVSLFRNGLMQKPGFDYSVNANQLTFLSASAPQPGDVLQVSYRMNTAPLPGFADAETPAGAVNGINKSFQLANTPAPAGSVTLYRNGVLQRPGVAYTISGGIIQFNTAPAANDVLLAYYRY